MTRRSCTGRVIARRDSTDIIKARVEMKRNAKHRLRMRRSVWRYFWRIGYDALIKRLSSHA